MQPMTSWAAEVEKSLACRRMFLRIVLGGEKQTHNENFKSFSQTGSLKDLISRQWPYVLDSGENSVQKVPVFFFVFFFEMPSAKWV